MVNFPSTAAFESGGSHVLVWKMETVFNLTSAEREALCKLPINIVAVTAGQDVLHQGDRPNRCCTILDGFAATTKVTREGRRQFVAIHMRGDVPDLQSLHLEVMDIGISTLSRCTIGFVQHDALISLCEHHPRLSAALWRDSLVCASGHREWIVNLGQREAYARLAHFLCEMFVRMKLVGLVVEETGTLPVTQQALADVLGTSSVHVNRTLQELRASGTLSWDRHELSIHDWPALQKIAGFDATYLHLTQAQAAIVKVS
jgi:CRP-like cAMP-binding protein